MTKKLMNKFVKNLPKYMNDVDPLNSGQSREVLKAFELVFYNDLSLEECEDYTEFLMNNKVIATSFDTIKTFNANAKKAKKK